MKIVNITNEHLLSHRYGWHKIIYELSNNINSDIILVDFMDKYFNLWFEFKKQIKYNKFIYKLQNNNEDTSKEFIFMNKDAYYHINDIEKSDVFIYTDKIGIYHIFKWYPEFNDFKLMKGAIIQHFKKKITSNSIDKPWIGIIHYPEFTKEMNYESFESIPNILQSNTFKESYKYCRGIITLSYFLKIYLQKNLIDYEYNIPISVLYHPTNFSCKLFNFKYFIANKNKKIIQIGFWMRKMNTIYNIKTDKFIKYWLPGGSYWREMFNQIYPNHQEYYNDKSIIIKMYLNDNEYDTLLSENIALIDIFNSSANNTVLECIARNTPLLATYHPAIVEYLGEDYPLYFKSIDELNNIINSDTFISKIKLSYNYLLNMNKDNFKLSSFIKGFNNILITIDK